MKHLLMIGAVLAALWGSAEAAEITVSAAASLANAFDEMKDAFERKKPGITVHCNYAASDPLLRQIAAGAPVDVFAAADQATMDRAAAQNLIDEDTRKNFAANGLVLIVPKNGAKPESVSDLLKFERIAIGNPDSVPAGRYAREALQNAGLWEALEPRLILASSVRQALQYAASGEVDAAFVYATDARQQGDKVEVAMEVDGHAPVTYPIAVVAGANPEAGREFLEFTLSPQGQAILEKYGFGRP